MSIKYRRVGLEVKVLLLHPPSSLAACRSVCHVPPPSARPSYQSKNDDIVHLAASHKIPYISAYMSTIKQTAVSNYSFFSTRTHMYIYLITCTIHRSRISTMRQLACQPNCQDFLPLVMSIFRYQVLKPEKNPKALNFVRYFRLNN